MRTRISGLLLATTIGLTGLLSACGNDDADEPDTADETTQSTEETESTEDASAADTGQDEEVPEASGDKPSREDVIDGYREIVLQNSKQAGVDMPGDVATKVVTCFIDEVYEDASPKTLQALADENAAGIDPADAQLFTSAQTTCQKKVVG